MWPAAAALVAVTLAAAPASERVLVCRSQISGDPALARGDALVEAVRDRSERALDYGVPCESIAEAARAARRAGLSHAIHGTASGRTDASLYELTVVTAEDRVVEVRKLAIPPGIDGVRPIGAALDALMGELRRPRTRTVQRRAAIGIAGGGVALVAAGLLFTAAAREDADRANHAASPDEYLGATKSWRSNRGLSAAALGVGGAVLVGGIGWRIQLGGED